MPVEPTIFSRFTAFRGLALPSQGQLSRRAELLRPAAGSRLFAPGERPASVHLLLEGCLVQDDAAGATVGHLVAGEANTPDLLPPTLPAPWGLRCAAGAAVVAIDAALLEITLAWGQSPRLEVGEIAAADADTVAASGDWMLRLLQARSFQRLSPASLDAMFRRMTPVSARAGEVLMRQGETGEHFYVIREGRCRVLHDDGDRAPTLLAEFGAGECFGEEALLADQPRSATVQAIVTSQLLRLGRADFDALLADAILRRVSYREARSQVEARKACWLDVRPTSTAGASPAQAIHRIPYPLLRSRARQLPRDVAYVCVCDNGRRAAVAAFVLGQIGLDAYVLDGGLERLRQPPGTAA